ncbi:hypothetical protein FRC07_011288 [Ceratobasidium sp. 392]|nr:hypothetical protein FRC07_011288 [Ceratobasidium sp. 392]
METNNLGRCQLALLESHDGKESNLDVQSSVLSVFSPELSFHEAEDVPIEETEALERNDGATYTPQSLAIHEPDLLEFLTECFLKTEEWKLAANAFVSAGEFELAAKNFCRTGCLVEAVGLVKKHKGEIRKEIADGIIETARLECLRQSQYEKAAELFDSAEEQLEYMKTRGFNSAQDPALENRRRNDAIALARRNHDVLEYIRLLSTSSEDLMHQAVTHVLRGLWMTLPLGYIDDQLRNPAVKSLLDQASKFDTKILNEDESRQIEMFQAVYARKTDIFIPLAEANALASRTSEALICFAQCSGDLHPSQSGTLSTFLHHSTLALRYYTSLDTLARAFQASSVDTQRFLGFEPVEPNDDTSTLGSGSPIMPKYRLFSSSFMFESVKDVTLDVEPTPFMLGLTTVMLSESEINRLANNRILGKLEREIHVMHVMVNTLSYLRPCWEFAIFGSCVNSCCRRLELISHNLPNGIRQTQFNERLRAHILQVLITDLYPPRQGSDNQVCRRHVVSGSLVVDENVLVHLFESIGRRIIVQARMRKYDIPGIFNGLLLPRSWALDIFHEPAQPCQREPLDMFLDSLYKTLEYMRIYESMNGVPNGPPFYGAYSAPDLLLRGVFILRICRLLILVATNLEFAPTAKNAVRIAIASSLTGPGAIHNTLCDESVIA